MFTMDYCFLVCDNIWLWNSLHKPVEAADIHYGMQYQYEIGRSHDIRSYNRCDGLAFANASS